MKHKKMFSLSLSLFVALGNLAFVNHSFAAHNTKEDSLKLYEAIAIKSLTAQDQSTTLEVTSKIELPVSRNFDQQMTGLCWTYGFFNALETLHLVEHPDEDTLELSRGAMQYINMQDRIERQIQGIENHVDPNGRTDWAIEGGTATDAVYLLKEYGAYQYNDYHNILSGTNYKNLLKSVFAASTADERRQKASEELPKHFNDPLPEKTFFNGEWLTPVAFGTSLVTTGEWNSYAISKDDKEFWSEDPDSDARAGSMTYFMSREKVISKITTALKNNRPVVYSNIAHLILIYGAEFDANNNPIKFYIKNSNGFPQFFYKADAKKTIDNLGEISVLE